ncbi:MAG: acetolactate synthase large subunit [Gemmatimonadaceae bacterium]
MNGAHALLHTLANAGIEVCFTNPGTSEMHFVAALDSVPQMRPVLCLFEGVATGAADGYARMADKPAATLLHLGCGLGNGLANLHNARKGKVPIVNIVGDHATYHVQYDAQLQSDIETVARNVSPGFVRTARSTATLGSDVADAVAAAKGPPGQVATLVLPADVSWSDGGSPATLPASPARPVADDAAIAAVAKTLSAGRNTALLLGGAALREPGLMAAARLAAHSGVRLLAEVFPTRLARGAGLPAVERVAYLGELATVQLKDLHHLILVDAKTPVTFFAYPGKKSTLVPDSCNVVTLATGSQDVVGSLEALCHAVGANAAAPVVQPASPPSRPRGKKLSAETVCQAVGHLLPERAILIDEAITSGFMLGRLTAGARRHDLITLTGGAIGQGLPNAVGAAIACPDRTVVALIGDGTAMYTIQALWTMARENLHVVAVIFNNAAYAILDMELQRVGANQAGPKAKGQLDLHAPVLNFVSLAQGMGVPAVRASTNDAFVEAFERALATPGPHLIDAVVPPALGGTKLKMLQRVLGVLDDLPQPVARAVQRTIVR